MSRFLLSLLLAVATSAGAQWPGYTNKPSGGGSSSVTIGTTPITGGATTQVLYNLAGVVSSSSDFIYNDTSKRLTVGSGTTTSAGITCGYEGTNSGFSACWRTGITPSSSNYGIRFSSGITSIGADGTGSSVVIAPNNSGKVTVNYTAGEGMVIGAGVAATAVNALWITQTWNFATTPITMILANATNTSSHAAALLMDLQVGGVSQFNVTKGGGINALGDIALAGGSQISFQASTIIRTPSGDGTLRLSNAAASDFGRLQFGGTTSSFPALKRSGTGLLAQLADDSALGWFQAAYYSTSAQVTETAATHSVATTTSYLIANRAGTITVTLPTASSFTGRQLHIRTIQAQTVVSNASNVVPLAGGAAGTAILAATAGKWAKLVSDGTNWNIEASN